MSLTAKEIGQALLTLIEGDAIQDFGPALGTAAAAETAANGDPLKLAAASIQLKVNLLAAAPAALGQLEGQLGTVIGARLTNLITAGAAKTASALATLEGTTSVATSGQTALASG